MNWKNKTCKECKFQISGECHLNPPMINIHHTYLAVYPLVYSSEYVTSMMTKPQPKKWLKSCSKYED